MQRRIPIQLLHRVQIWPQLVPLHLPTSQALQFQHMFSRRRPLRFHPVQPLPHSALRDFQGLRGRGLSAQQLHRSFKRVRRHMLTVSRYTPFQHFGSRPVNTLRGLNYHRHGRNLPDMRETLGTRLKKARADAGLTQEELARAAGVTQKTISKIERGDQVATAAIVPLARALGVTPEWLAEGAQSKPSPAQAPPPAQDAAPGAWLVHVIQVLIANGVPPEEAIRLSNEAAQASREATQKGGSKKTG